MFSRGFGRVKVKNSDLGSAKKAGASGMLKLARTTAPEVSRELAALKGPILCQRSAIGFINELGVCAEAGGCRSGQLKDCSLDRLDQVVIHRVGYAGCRLGSSVVRVRLVVMLLVPVSSVVSAAIVG